MLVITGGGIKAIVMPLMREDDKLASTTIYSRSETKAESKALLGAKIDELNKSKAYHEREYNKNKKNNDSIGAAYERTKIAEIDKEIEALTENKTEADKKKAYEIAFDNGFDSPSHLINSVKKRTGQEFENVQDIPKEVIAETVKSREGETKQMAIFDKAEVGQFVESSEGYVYKITKVLGGRRFKIQDKDGNEATVNSEMFDMYTTDKTFEEKPKITQIKEANPDRILVVKPTPDKPKGLETLKVKKNEPNNVVTTKKYEFSEDSEYDNGFTFMGELEGKNDVDQS
jgi:AraC-like DNA-binding protein